jgi:hypothetical protein
MTRTARICFVVTSIAFAALDAHAQPSSSSWSMRSTDHFDIYAQPAQRARVDEIAREAERVYARLSNLLHRDLAAKMDILLVATDRDAPRDAQQAYALVRASRASTRDHLLLSIETFDRSGSSVLAHELTHQFMFELLPGWQQTAWVAEALSDHHAGSWQQSEVAALRAAVLNGQIPTVERLTTSDRHWGHAVFDFVATEYGARGVRAYLAALRDIPSTMRDPIRVAFDTTPADFNAAFRDFVAARYGR